MSLSAIGDLVGDLRLFFFKVSYRKPCVIGSKGFFKILSIMGLAVSGDKLLVKNLGEGLLV